MIKNSQEIPIKDMLRWELKLAIGNAVDHLGWQEGSKLARQLLSEEKRKKAVNMAIEMWRNN